VNRGLIPTLDNSCTMLSVKPNDHLLVYLVGDLPSPKFSIQKASPNFHYDFVICHLKDRFNADDAILETKILKSFRELKFRFPRPEYQDRFGRTDCANDITIIVI